MNRKPRKVTPEVIAEIIRLSRNPHINQKQIAKEMKLAGSTVSKVLNERKRVIDAASRGEVVRGIVPEVKKDTSDFSKRMLEAKIEKRIASLDQPVRIDSVLMVIDYNGVNIHVDKNTVTDVFVDGNKIRLITK